MTKKKTMKNIKTPNKFDEGGMSFREIFSRDNLIKGLPGLGGIAGGVAGGLLSNGFSTTGGQVLSGVGDAAMMFNPLIGGAIKLASGLVNRGFGTKWDNEGLAKADNQIEDLNNFQSGASTFDTLSQDFTKLGSMNKTIKASDLGKDGWFVNRTGEKANELNTDLGKAYNYAMRNLNNVADNISGNTLANLERNYAAFGGPLFAYGGQTHGANFTNGLMFVNNGGTHESNPYEGVPISMDQEGNPNLVEEGEVIWNDYVFSNRLKVPKSIQKKYKLGKREMTFANAVDKLSKESEERPNDPISMRGLENVLMNMAIEQETIKQKNNTTNSNKFAEGGPSGIDPLIADSPYPTVTPRVDTSQTVVAGEDGVAIPGVTIPIKPLPTWMRYVPSIGLGLGVLTDTFGITNKPDYSNANAIIKATKNNAVYDPIKFNPIGDYLTYNPFDTEYHANQLRAVSGANRRNLMNTSGGNRATAMAGILASDNNTMNQLGDLYRKAAEYNLEQRQRVADFNKATNQFNSEGIFRADSANQNAAMQARALGLEGLMAGYKMRDNAKVLSDQARSANLSGLFEDLGNIGYENTNMNMARWASENGIYGPGTEDYYSNFFPRRRQ